MDYISLAQKILSHANFRGANSVLHEKVEMQLFYADWCGHCTRLKPAWNEATRKGKRLAAWTKMDCTTDRSLAKKHNVSSFPTIHRVSGNRRTVFVDERTPERIIKFAETGR